MAVKRERLRVAERRAQIIDEFERRRLALPIVQAERAEIIRIDAGHEAKLHPPAQHLVDDGDLLGQPQRMIERHDIAHRADAQALGPRAGADRVQARRRHPALVGTEMMLDAERMIEAELVAQLQARATAARSADAASFRAWPRCGRSGRISRAHRQFQVDHRSAPHIDPEPRKADISCSKHLSCVEGGSL